MNTFSDRAQPAPPFDVAGLDWFDDAPCGYLCATLDGRVSRANRTLLAWLDCDAAELEGRTRFHDLFGNGARSFLDTQFQAALLTQGRIQDLALALRTRAGANIPVLLSAVLQPGSAGQPALIRMSLLDDTARRRNEHELAQARQAAGRLAEDMERHVAERTRELQDALMRAEAATSSKSRFLANMSHEIRTPLNCILGMTRLALEECADARQRDYLATIDRSGQDMLRLVSDILDLSKMEAGKVALNVQPLSVTALLDQAATQFRPLASAKGLLLRVQYSADVDQCVLGDALRLSQVLGNFVSNAIKFTERGEVEIRAALTRCDLRGARLRMDVRDTGIGIDAGVQHALFQAFAQGDSSSTRRYAGTGLGLAIARQLADLMQGSVGVNSRPGEGSVFWFECPLPFATEDAQEQAPAPVPVTLPRELLFGRLRGRRLLLAEDNPVNQELTQRLVAKTGAYLTVAGNGEEALQALETQDFDCVLMDVQMPVLDGLEATRRLRADARWAQLPVLALTANAFQSDREACLAAGMNDFLAKPIEPDMFYLKLARALDPELELPEHASLFAENEHALAPVQPAGDLISLSVLAALVDNDAETMARLLQLFLDNASSTLDEMEGALAARDGKQVGALGHRLKSSAKAVGATRFAAICAALEHAGGQLERAAEMIGELRRLLPLMQSQAAPAGALQVPPECELPLASFTH
jgi:signal transduction histidine kinase/DNA-binding response OmpR family regulator